MKNVFYFLAILPIVYEAMNIINPQKFIQLEASFKSSKIDEKIILSPAQKLLNRFMLFYIIWTFIGLWSSQWPAFLILFIIGLANSIIKLNWYRRIDAIVSFFLLLFIVLNAYHLQIDIWPW